ncbi:tryptophan synthase beta subunit-like PLP-dependent enzyme [Lojkania enalia]|uniref:Tryptophan synthase beta subunit-like PLP-dependent enzyme n=1 Tax=Lojkania enalia TaxID=147567 RepID=A0A9P4MX71_9PLEO|nr:tryptophan synthase beta subunit-like PLP-dependent enzyme [Didymosphaeria enalia]
MAEYNTLNVFKGPDAVVNYLHPDFSPPVPLVEIPAKLNPFRADNVRIFAKMLTALPAQNVKMLPALNMLLHQPDAAFKSIVEASSGSTALSLSIISRAMLGNEDVCAYVTNKKHPDSLRLLRFFGLKVALYGGLQQQDPDDPRGIMERLRKLVKKDDTLCYLGQYDNDFNWRSHCRWTGPQILQQLPEIDVLATTVGTGGCITGTGLYLKSQKGDVTVVGVFNEWGDPTPGPRHFPGFESSQFPWRETIDVFETVKSKDSYEMSMRLSREGIICGPSSGEALVGLLNFLQSKKNAGKLHELANKDTGEISCVFIACDNPVQYLDGYFSKLEESKFPPILNHILLQCDQDKYDERWELTPEGTLLAQKLGASDPLRVCRRRCGKNLACSAASQRSHSLVLDLRQVGDFRKEHIRFSISSPLKDLGPQTGDIYSDPEAVFLFWSALKSKIEAEKERLGSSRTILVLCYEGETSRLATSMLRGRGYEAFSVHGGFRALRVAMKRKKVKKCAGTF